MFHLPIEDGDIPASYMSLPEGNSLIYIGTTRSQPGISIPIDQPGMSQGFDPHPGWFGEKRGSFFYPVIWGDNMPI